MAKFARDCMLCGAPSKEFVLEPHDACPTINPGFCPCGELEQFENHIRDFLCQALKKRQELRSRVNYVHNRYFHQIPPEVVSCIFLFFISPHKHERLVGAPHSYRLSRSEVSGALVLGAVCRKWRAIAWSTPRLWSSIAIRLSLKSFSSKLTVAREWLDRSGQLPLSISLIQKIMSTRSTNELIPMVHLLNEYASRWHSLKLYTLPPSLLSAFNVNESSILHTIDIDSSYGRGRPSFGTSYLLPKVVRVSGLQFSSIGIDWSKVTQVQSHGFSVDECIELFRRAPLLTDCKFFEVFSGDQQTYPLPDGHIVHTSLTSLCLQPDERSVIDTFLRHLSLPSLLELVLGDDSDRSYTAEFSTDTVTSFLARSSPPLKTLRLLRPIIEHERELVRLLEKTSELTHLCIKRLRPHGSTNYTPRHLFTRLAESWLVGDHTNEHFLPKLQSLHCSGRYSHHWDDVSNAFGPISEITNSRRRPLNQLWFKWFDNDDDDDDDDHIDQESMRKLVALKDAGIDLKIVNAASPAVDLISYYSLDES